MRKLAQTNKQARSRTHLRTTALFLRLRRTRRQRPLTVVNLLAVSAALHCCGGFARSRGWIPPTHGKLGPSPSHAERRPAGWSKTPSQTARKPDDKDGQIKCAPTEPKAIPGPQDIGCTMRSHRTSVKPDDFQLTGRRIEEQLTQPKCKQQPVRKRSDNAMPARRTGRKSVKEGSGSHTRETKTAGGSKRFSTPFRNPANDRPPKFRRQGAFSVTTKPKTTRKSC